MEKSLREKIKSILGMPVEKVEDVVPETTEATAITEQTEETATEVVVEMAEEKSSTDQTPDATETVEKVEMNSESTIADNKALEELQTEITNLKSAIAELITANQNFSSQQEKIKEAIELIADQPSSVAPKKTESLFSKNTAPTKSNEERAKNLLKLFDVR